MDLRSPLGKVKGLGAAKNGAREWLSMRIAALALVPLTIWFVTIVIRASTGAETLISFLKSPFDATAMILFLGVALYHGCLGIKEIIEDYVHCHCAKTFLLIVLKFFTAITATLAVLAVIFVHINGGIAKKPANAVVTQEASDTTNEVWKNEFFNLFKENISE